MTKIKNLEDLKLMKDGLRSKIDLREKGESPENKIQIRVTMGTCGIAAGAKETMNLFIQELEKKSIEAVITQTGCMGHCSVEPTVEIKLQNQNAILFGGVNTAKVSEIIEKYIVNNELVEGVINTNGLGGK